MISKSVETVKSGIELFRYDIIEPPKTGWNKDFKSPIYCWDEEGAKNDIGAIFLFDKENIAVDVARNVIKQKEQLIREFNFSLSIWLTRTVVKDELRMLDLTACKDIVDLFITLWNNDIIIFRKDFYKFDKLFGSKPMSLLLEDIRYLALEDGKKEKNKVSTCKCNIENFYNTYEDQKKLPYACQELTDFSNGKIFKELIEEKGIDGYIFKETDANTFCIFNSNKLSNPVTIKI